MIVNTCSERKYNVNRLVLFSEHEYIVTAFCNRCITDLESIYK